MKALELTGKRFGKLLVVSRIPCLSKKKSSRWLAKCDCGNEVCGTGNYIKTRTQCDKCSRGVIYDEIKNMSDGSVQITVQSREYGNQYILVDKEDLDKTLKYWWAIVKPKKVFYAQAWCRTKSNGERRGGRLHQLIMGFPEGIIDHKNGNGLDNRKSNLRLATPSQSAANRTAEKDKLVPFKGVSFIKNKNLYVVQLRKNNQLIHGGLFKNPLLAAVKYNELALKHHGEFAKLNEFTDKQLKEIQTPAKETRRINKNNATGYIGVSLKRKGFGKKRYIATICVNGKNKFIGVFNTAKEAAKAYNESAIKYKGIKASLNILK